MRKILKGALILIVLTIALAFMLVSQTMAEDTETFSYKSPDFAVTVPKWENQKSQNPDAVLRRINNPSGLPCLEVTVSDRPDGMTYKDVAAAFSKSVKEYWEASSCKTLYEREIKLKDGTPAYEMEVQWKHPLVLVNSYFVVLFKDKKMIYVVGSSFGPVPDNLKQYPLSLVQKGEFGPATKLKSGVAPKSDQYKPAQTTYVPPSGRGPIVIMISGQTGPDPYQTFAKDLAMLGYYTVLIDGKVFLTTKEMGAANLKNAISQAQTSSNGIPGKVAVVGYSLGGGASLVYATSMPDVVSAVIAYYPNTTWIPEAMNEFVTRFKVPILALAGEADTYLDCCLIEKIRAMDTAAKSKGLPFELVVYPSANHAFNRADITAWYRPADATDSWRRTVEMLGKYHPLR